MGKSNALPPIQTSWSVLLSWSPDYGRLWHCLDSNLRSPYEMNASSIDSKTWLTLLHCTFKFCNSKARSVIVSCFLKQHGDLIQVWRGRRRKEQLIVILFPLSLKYILKSVAFPTSYYVECVGSACQMGNENIQALKVPTYCGIFKGMELSSRKHEGFFFLGKKL